MKKIRTLIHLTSVVVLAALIGLPLSYQARHNEVSFKDAASKVGLPTGRQVYAIAQAAETWPKIIEATIDPLDVHVGMTQTLEVVVQSPKPIISVIAKIEHDYGFDMLNLQFVEEVAVTESKLPFKVAKGGEILLPETNEYALIETANAQTEYPKYKYRGAWLVHSTHDTTYETVFEATDIDSQSNTVTIAWTDACGIPPGGDFTLSSPCTISAVDGVDNGNVTINDTLTLNANFAFNSGKSFQIGSGSVVICTGCEIKKTNIWVPDADGDTYPGVGMTLADSNPGGQTRRYAASNQSDCYDSNANARPGQTSYFTTHRGDGSFDYDCNTTIEKNAQPSEQCFVNASEYYCGMGNDNTGYACGENYGFASGCYTVGPDYCNDSNIFYIDMDCR